jgi:hypothetical protein
VDNADLLAANRLGVLEGVAQDTLAGLAGDELDALDDAVNDNVLNARVLALGVLADQDRVDVVVGGLVAGNRAAGTQVGEEVEGAAEGEVEGDVALANGGSKRTLEGNLVLVDVLDGGIGNGGLAVLQDGGDIDSLPSDGGLVTAKLASWSRRTSRAWAQQTLAAAKMSLTDSAISGPIPSPSMKLTR